jgi:SAM-dependent methyltransferase
MTPTGSFDDFLKFERQVFGENLPIPIYDGLMIRYGEYRFASEMLAFNPTDAVLDLGCETNIFILYLAYLGMCPLGVDLNPAVWPDLQARAALVERATGRKLRINFCAQDATQLDLPPASVDKAIAISSIEHMFCAQGNGDQLAIASLARVLKPGGLAVVTVPMSEGDPFHEEPVGDEILAGPYRLYTPETLQERILSQPDLEVVRLGYLAHSTPDPRFPPLYFFRFWRDILTEAERAKWAWANPILVSVFNPIIAPEEGASRLETVNTALVCLRKRAWPSGIAKAPETQTVFHQTPGYLHSAPGRVFSDSPLPEGKTIVHNAGLGEPSAMPIPLPEARSPEPHPLAVTGNEAQLADRQRIQALEKRVVELETYVHGVHRGRVWRLMMRANRLMGRS